jgi:anaerobic selenocysteine-containing dehydrogenase
VKPLYDTVEPAEALLRIGGALGAETPWKDAGEWYSGVSAALGAQELLKKGGAKQLDTAAPAQPSTDGGAWAAATVRAALGRRGHDGFPLALALFVPLAFHQGRGAHLPYLHGIAQVGGREVWQTTVELHPASAAALRIRDGKSVVVESPRGKIHAVARVRHGIRPDSVAIAIGLGRKALGKFAAERGANPIELVASGEPTYVRVREAT